MIGWWPIIGTLVTGFLAGGAAVVEACLSLRLPLSAGRSWLFVAFTVDTMVTIVAYELLRAALKEDFIGEPISIYALALVWGPFILRARIELLVPVSKTWGSLLGALSSGRQAIWRKVDAAQAQFFNDWIFDFVLPAVENKGISLLFDRWVSQVRGSSMEPSKKDELLKHASEAVPPEVRDGSRDPTVEEVSSMSFLLLKNNGHSTLRNFVNSATGQPNKPA